MWWWHCSVCFKCTSMNSCWWDPGKVNEAQWEISPPSTSGCEEAKGVLSRWSGREQFQVLSSERWSSIAHTAWIKARPSPVRKEPCRLSIISQAGDWRLEARGKKLCWRNSYISYSTFFLGWQIMKNLTFPSFKWYNQVPSANTTKETWKRLTQ